tara:strand:- start:2709 stop:2972 length:264 start_codon:yes stop_codon:yes gene_type:complete
MANKNRTYHYMGKQTRKRHGSNVAPAGPANNTDSQIVRDEYGAPYVKIGSDGRPAVIRQKDLNDGKGTIRSQMHNAKSGNPVPKHGS